MILKGVSPHLQCPCCHNLIQDPRNLVCSHTYCKACLGHTVRKTISFSKLRNYTNPLYKPNTSKNSICNNVGKVEEKSSLDSSLDRTLPTFLDTSLDDDEKGEIFNPAVDGMKQNPDKVGVNKKIPVISRASGKSGGKSKKGKKKHDSTFTGKSSCSGISSNNSNSMSSASAKTTAASGASKSQLRKQVTPDSDRQLEVIVCPECGMHTEIPGGNISLIPYNFFVQHIMDLMTFYSSAEPVPLVYCSTCRKDGLEVLPSAVARCSTCASFLCEQCFELHSMDDLTKLHPTLTITERVSSMFSCLTPDYSNVRTCKTHNSRPFTYYCITCSKGICETCSNHEHETHKFSKPEDLRSDFVTYIRDLMSRTCQLRCRMEGAVMATQELVCGIKLLAATQIEEVLRTQGVLSNALDRRLSVLLQEVDRLAPVSEAAAKD